MQSNHQLATTVLINHVPKDAKDQKTQMQKIHTLAVPGILPKLSSRGSEVLIEVVLLALLPWYGSTQPPLGQGGLSLRGGQTHWELWFSGAKRNLPARQTPRSRPLINFSNHS